MVMSIVVIFYPLDCGNFIQVQRQPNIETAMITIIGRFRGLSTMFSETKHCSNS